MTPEEIAVQGLHASMEFSARASESGPGGTARFVATLAAVVRRIGGHCRVEKDGAEARIVFDLPIPPQFVAPLEVELAAQEAFGDKV